LVAVVEGGAAADHKALGLALTNTTDEAVAAALSALADPFTLGLRRAEDEAQERLDEIRARLLGQMRDGVRVRLV